MGTKRCSKCREEKDVGAFHVARHLPSGRSHICKECKRAYDRDRYRRVGDKRRHQQREYYAAHRKQICARINDDPSHYKDLYAKNKERLLSYCHAYRARKRKTSQGNLRKIEAYSKMLRQQWCAGCGTTDSLTIDHIVPLSRDGSHDWENLQPLCKSCNCSKGAKTMEEWEASRT